MSFLTIYGNPAFFRHLQSVRVRKVFNSRPVVPTLQESGSLLQLAASRFLVSYPEICGGIRFLPNSLKQMAISAPTGRHFS
jgi:hypothetical protein